MKTDNKNVFEYSLESEIWVKREGLIFSEQFLFENYLDPTLETIEAGTSGGRILWELSYRGFEKLWGFDYVASSIEQAKKRDNSGKLHFSVMDATQLSYPDGKFSQAIYLQQIVCFIESAEGRKRAVEEAYRILCQEGIAVFSFLCLESRQSTLFYRLFMSWINFFRFLLRRDKAPQLQPWLKLGGKINLPAFFDVAPYVYWFRVEEAEKLLIDAGFRIVAVGTDEQILHNNMLKLSVTLRDKPKKGMLYFVCKK